MSPNANLADANLLICQLWLNASVTITSYKCAWSFFLFVNPKQLNHCLDNGNTWEFRQLFTLHLEIPFCWKKENAETGNVTCFIYMFRMWYKAHEVRDFYAQVLKKVGEKGLETRGVTIHEFALNHHFLDMNLE